jgi:hypothetical protein
MATTRMLPLNGATTTVTIPPPPVSASYARAVYTATSGGYIDAAGDPASGDASELTSMGFVLVAQSGATSARPVGAKPGTPYVDTTLGYVVIWDGANWRNPATGASV